MSEEPKRNTVWPAAAAVLAASVLGVWVYEQRAARRAEAEARDLYRQNQALQSELAKLRIQPAAPASVAGAGAPASNAAPAAAATEQQPPRPPRGPEMVPTPTGDAFAPRSDGLILAGAHAAPSTNGIRATMRFTATTEDALGIIAVVVRLPRDGEARIVDLAPMGEAQFSDVSRRVSPDGKFAVYQGTAGKLRALDIALTVSGETVADVRGTCGVGPLTLAVSPGGAEIKK